MSLSDITFGVGDEGYMYAYYKNIKGFLNKADCQNLISHAKSLGNNAKYLETGTFMGVSAHLIAMNSSATVWCHDIWALTSNIVPEECPSECFFEFYKCVSDNSLQNRVIPITGNSLKTVSIHADQSIDLAFIDGDHTYDGAIGDFRNVLPKMKKGGVILAHDCSPGTDCIRAITDFAAETGQRFEILPGTCGMGRIVVV
jgi:hypothetical protein